MRERRRSGVELEEFLEGMQGQFYELSEDERSELESRLSSQRARVQQVAEEKGLRRFSHEYSTVWVPKDQEEKTGSIPSRFFTQRSEREGGVLFEEHTFSFPIEDPAQLTKSFEALRALYEVDPTYDDGVRNDLQGFMKFVSGLAEPKQPKVQNISKTNF